MASPAAPGSFLCFLAFVLLVFVSVSPPTWDKVSFLDVTTGEKIIRFGVFGFTGSSRSIGYNFDLALVGLPTNKLSTGIVRVLTGALILNPIAAGLSALAFVFGVCNCRCGIIYMTALSGIVTGVAFAIDIALCSIVRSRIREVGAAAGTTAQFGNANWLTLCAVFALSLASCAGVLGSCCRRYRK
ncbi:pali-domain-containing protein [Hysterangium stoloniferum]|nr:pali-domain-containing protein [Hysterangium stoloniferum]KAF8522933.1 pali-domain-containing protein [Hysterangium stoloniferum]